MVQLHENIHFHVIELYIYIHNDVKLQRSLDLLYRTITLFESLIIHISVIQYNGITETIYWDYSVCKFTLLYILK